MPWNGLGVVAVVLMIGLMVFRGLLIPRSTHQDMIQDRDQWRRSSEDWRAAFESSQELKRALVEQNAQLIRNAELSVRELEAIRGQLRGQQQNRGDMT